MGNFIRQLAVLATVRYQSARLFPGLSVLLQVGASHVEERLGKHFSAFEYPLSTD